MEMHRRMCNRRGVRVRVGCTRCRYSRGIRANLRAPKGRYSARERLPGFDGNARWRNSPLWIPRWFIERRSDRTDLSFQFRLRLELARSASSRSNGRSDDAESMVGRLPDRPLQNRAGTRRSVAKCVEYVYGEGILRLACEEPGGAVHGNTHQSAYGIYGASAAAAASVSPLGSAVPAACRDSHAAGRNALGRRWPYVARGVAAQSATASGRVAGQRCSMAELWMRADGG